MAGDVNASVADLKGKVRLCFPIRAHWLRWRFLHMQ